MYVPRNVFNGGNIMKKDLVEFYEQIVSIGSKEIVQYEDEKGNLMLLPLAQLFLSCEYCELDDKEYERALFNKIVDKDLELSTTTTTRAVDKSTITGNKDDELTIVDKEVEVKQVWIVRNGLQLCKGFNNKEEAHNLVKTINEKFLKLANIIEE